MSIQGTGLILSICKQIIEHMGGKISVQSKVGVGSKFTIELEMQAIDQISSSLINESQMSLREIYSQKIINNFQKIDKKENGDLDQKSNPSQESYSLGSNESDESYSFSSDENHKSEVSNKNRSQFLQIEKNMVLFQFINSNIQKSGERSDICQALVHNMLNKMKYTNQVTGQWNASENKSSFNQSEQIQNNNVLNNQFQEKNVQSPISRGQIILQKQDQQNVDEDNKKNLFKYENYQNSVNISEIISDKNSSFSLRNNVKEEYKPNNNQLQYLKQPSLKVKNYKRFISKRFKQDDEEDDQEENKLFDKQVLQDQEKANQNQIKDLQDQSSYHFQDVEQYQDNNAQKSSIKKEKSSKQGILQALQFSQNHLSNNEVIREVMSICFKYKKEKLKILAAINDSYSLLNLEAFIDKYENVSLIDSVENGKAALDLVKRNEESQVCNFYNVIILDLEMTQINGNEACQLIQQYYFSLKRKGLFQELPSFFKNRINTKIESIKFNDLKIDYKEQWILDLKKMYDIFQEIDQKQEFASSLDINNQNIIQNSLKNEILKVFNILYQKLKYKSLKYLGRPFIFGYSTSTDQKTKDGADKSGFDKCIQSPMNQLKIEQILDQYVEYYSFHLTKQMLENLGPVPKFKEMIESRKVLKESKQRSNSLYSSIFRQQENKALNSNGLIKYNQQDERKRNELFSFGEQRDANENILEKSSKWNHGQSFNQIQQNQNFNLKGENNSFSILQEGQQKSSKDLVQSQKFNKLIKNYLSKSEITQSLLNQKKDINNETIEIQKQPPDYFKKIFASLSLIKVLVKYETQILPNPEMDRQFLMIAYKMILQNSLIKQKNSQNSFLQEKLLQQQLDKQQNNQLLEFFQSRLQQSFRSQLLSLLCQKLEVKQNDQIRQNFSIWKGGSSKFQMFRQKLLSICSTEIKNCEIKKKQIHFYKWKLNSPRENGSHQPINNQFSE